MIRGIAVMGLKRNLVKGINVTYVSGVGYWHGFT